jgi:two-component system chemotaxis response regulator CheB
MPFSEAWTPFGLYLPGARGPLWEIRDEKILRFRCRVGHAYTAESMLAGKSEALEGAMWSALNTLEESTQISQRLAADSRARGQEHAAARFEERARKTKGQAGLIRQALDNGAAAATEETG